MKSVYTLLHKEGVDFGRDLNADKINNIMGRYSVRLQSPTIYIETLNELDEYFKKYPKIRFNKSSDPKRVFPGTTGAAGIWIGTYLAFKEFLLTDADALFMLEDDIRISRNFFKITNLYAEELSKDWEVLSLLIPWDTIKHYNSGHEIPGHTYLCRMYQDWSTGCYMVSRRGAERAIEDIEKNGISAPIDFYLYNYRYDQEVPQIKFNSFNIKPDRIAPARLAPESNKSYIGAMEVYKA